MLTGDPDVNDAALRLQPGSTPAQAMATLRRLPFGAALERVLDGVHALDRAALLQIATVSP